MFSKTSLALLSSLLLPAEVWALAPKSVNVLLQAQWNGTSLLLEASEFFHSRGRYWSFVDGLLGQLSSHSGDSLQLSDKEEHDVAEQVARSLAGEVSAKVLSLSLALRTFSPVVQTYRSLFENLQQSRNVAEDLLGCPTLLSFGDLGADLLCWDEGVLFSNMKLTSEGPQVEEYGFDKVYPGSPLQGLRPTVVMYANLNSPASAGKVKSAHTELTKLAESGDLRYIMRPLVPACSTLVDLQGYDAELAIKNMEYKVLDDSKIEFGDDDTIELSPLFGSQNEDVDIAGFYFGKLTSRYPDIAPLLTEFRQELSSQMMDEKEMNVWDMKDMGIAASQRILSSSDPLQLLKDLSQNFPMYAPLLPKIRIDETMRKALTKNRLVPEGESVLSINGKLLKEFDSNAIFEILDKESSTLDSLKALHLPASTIKSLTELKAASASAKSYPGVSQKTKYRIRMGTGKKKKSKSKKKSGSMVAGPLTWINDLTDGSNPSWSKSVQALLEPAWPGQLRFIARNIVNCLIVSDVATKEGLSLLAQTFYFAENKAPCRFGFVLSVPPEGSASQSQSASWPKQLPRDAFADFVGQDEATPSDSSEQGEESPQALIILAFSYFEEEFDNNAARKFLKLLIEYDKDLTATDVESAFIKHTKKLGGKKKEAEIKAQFEVAKKLKNGRKLLDASRRYTAERGLVTSGRTSYLIVNGLPSTIVADGHEDLQSLLVSEINAAQQELTMLVYEGKVSDATDMLTFFDSGLTAFSKIDKQIIQQKKEIEFVQSLPVYGSVRYFLPTHETKENEVKDITHLVVADFGTKNGIMLALASLQLLADFKATHNCRVGIVFNDKQSPGVVTRFLSTVIKTVVLDSKTRKITMAALKLVHYLHDRLQEKATEDVLGSALQKLAAHFKLKSNVVSAIHGDRAGGGGYSLTDLHDFHAAHFGGDNIGPGENLVVSNGRIVRMDLSAASVASLLLNLQLINEFDSRFNNGDKISAVIKTTSFEGIELDELTTNWLDHVAMSAALTLNKRNQDGHSSSSIEFVEDDKSVFHLPNAHSLMHVHAVIDPLSKSGQKLSTVLAALHSGFGCDIHVQLNPLSTITEFPLKRFYRYSLNPSLGFNDETGSVAPQILSFRKLRTKSVLTLNLQTPESWVLESSHALYDMDNLLLSDLESDSVTAVYNLAHILIAGHCYDLDTHQPPAGLQLDLSNQLGVKVADTVVMKNLGYFQLQANPGVWTLSMHGNANKLYTIAGANQAGTSTSQVLIPVTSFNDPAFELSVKRLPGQENLELSDFEEPSGSKSSDSGGLWNSFFGDKAENEEEESAKDETIHVFSLASGHLYERFLKIMMQSVIRSTKSPVKFWFLENFASPQFKEFVPLMAKELGYEVEFVTYKWPEWLRRQEEKQRVIWGYKILFLDVLFPLDVKRIIYIDADQVVRGDIKELWELDMGEAPYGYTPFCDSNKDTEGFRFWKQGYWESQLRGRPYHISALYVVDLVKFRQTRSGDTLRMLYDNLSADKNSLSNLDQDLPNYAQDMVPIYSLPQEWLWCETWCSMDTLPAAKTIDLCNNPLTKTPKLEMAKKLLPEWVEFDDRASNMQHSFEQRSQATGLHEEL